MIYFKVKRRRWRLNIRKFLGTVAAAIVIISFVYTAIDVVRFPELYSTTRKYQLQNEVEAEIPEAVDYYNRVYRANGIKLFND